MLSLWSLENCNQNNQEKQGFDSTFPFDMEGVQKAWKAKNIQSREAVLCQWGRGVTKDNQGYNEVSKKHYKTQKI